MLCNYKDNLTYYDRRERLRCSLVHMYCVKLVYIVFVLVGRRGDGNMSVNGNI